MDIIVKCALWYDDSDRITSITGTDGSLLQYLYKEDSIVSSVTSTINGITKTTSYSYDDSDKLTGVTTVNGSTLSYAYDSLGRTDHRDIALANGSYVTAYTYTAGANSTTTGKVASISNNGVATQYTYDANNNISTITSNGQTITYTYNSLDELVREDNQVLNKTIVYAYDAGGNILSKTEYPYTTSTTLGTATNTITYTYGDSTWKDKLTSYNGNAITYDAAGNTLTYNGYTFTWEAGRQLAAISGNGQTISYKYNDSGYRTEKTVNGVTTKYYLDGDKVVLENTGSGSIYYSYDAENKLVSLTLNNTEYFYIRNGQGDITGLIDTSGTQVVSYVYDSWGKLISIDGSLKDTVGLKNPYRYRGYRYDTETGLYYLQSRYYNPDMGRYINADDVEFLGSSGTSLSYNLFAYCENSPVTNVDPSGYWVVGAYIEPQAACGIGVFFRLGLYFDGTNLLLAFTAGLQFQVNASAGITLGFLYYPSMKNVSYTLGIYTGTSLGYSWGAYLSLGVGYDWANLKVGASGALGYSISILPLTYRIDAGWSWKINQWNLRSVMSLKNGTKITYSRFLYPSVTITKYSTYLLVTNSKSNKTIKYMFGSKNIYIL